MRANYSSWFRFSALFMSAILLFQISFPTLLWASEGGPQSAEFTSFQSGKASTSVNKFTGAFHYSIPLLTVPGPEGSSYPIGLSYGSGLSPESEASWVGYGWTLNPGAINRNLNGYADDHQGQQVTNYNRMPASQTVSLQVSPNLEMFGLDADKIYENTPLSKLSPSATFTYNNYHGWGLTKSLEGYTGKGLLNLEYSKDETDDRKVTAKLKLEKLLSHKKVKNSKFMYTDFGKGLKEYNDHYDPGLFKFYSKALKNYPTRNLPYTGFSASAAVSLQFNVTPLPAGAQAGATLHYARQKNVEENDDLAYGYLYNHEATQNDLMDYSMERAVNWAKNDYFLGIPTSGADFFSVHAEGLSGGFRLFSRDVGHFYPNTASSIVDNYSVVPTAELMIGTDAGAETSPGDGVLEKVLSLFAESTNLSEGLNNSVSGAPEEKGNLEDYGFSGAGDEPYYFMFMNDPAANQSFGVGDEAQKAKLDKLNGLKGWKNYEAKFPTTIQQSVSNGVNSNRNRITRSSFIDFHTNEEMLETEGTVLLHAYTRDQATLNHVNRNDADLKPGIGEIAITNTEGNRYVFGLPVYAKEEKQIQYSVDDMLNTKVDQTVAIMNTGFTDAEPKRKFGSYTAAPYASAYLLTQINTPQYRDLTGDGPSADDHGGFVKFGYTRTFGDNDKVGGSNFFKWRSPYLGLSYSRNEIASDKDDMGGFASGEKEVYYLEDIETKTHIAEFITSDREDGLEALADDDEAARNDTIPSSALSGLKRLKKLDRIDLYAKQEDGSKGEKLKSVHFEYDYSLMKGQPNSDAPQGGKLTLIKVWVDHYDHESVRISPYTFSYEYPQTSAYATEVQDRYSTITSYGSNFTSSNQNPDYSPAMTDRWGSYRTDGATLNNTMFPWVKQENETDFDPAAWHLKEVSTPLGGKVIIHYEQGDYQYVQDNRAMLMYNIQEPTSSNNDERKIYIDTKSTIGLDPAVATDEEALAQLTSLIHNELIEQDEQIYFRFLYSLAGTTPGVTDCSSEWVEGYAHVESVGWEPGNGIYLQLGTGSTNSPYWACLDLVDKEKGGLLNNTGACQLLDDDAFAVTDGSGVFDESKLVDVFYTAINSVKDLSLDPAILCRALDHELSYFRLPALFPKKGAGIRVKRLLTYDEGLQSGDANLYGAEYSYETEDENGLTISSGVAINEPYAGRAENPLVQVLARKTQKMRDNVIHGRDLKEMEGPLGESLMPAPSVGYSNVSVQNIHTGKTNPGFSEHVYYTAKDFPVEEDHTKILHEKDKIQVPAGVINKTVNSHWLTQGYAFVLNDMHGKPRSSSNYAGNPDDPDTHTRTAFQQYTYYQPGEAIPVQLQGEKDVVDRVMGKETEIIVEARSHRNIVGDVSMEIDPSIAFIGVAAIPYLTLWPGFSSHREQIVSHVTNKVTRYTSHLQSKLSVVDGVSTLTTFDRYDELSGRPIENQYIGQFVSAGGAPGDGAYHRYDYLASHEFSPLGAACYNEGLTYTPSALSVKKMIGQDTLLFENTDGSPACPIDFTYCEGDLVKIIHTSGSGYHYYHLGKMVENKLEILPTDLLGTPTTYSLTFSTVHAIEVIRSGCQNQLTATLGHVTTYNKDIERLSLSGSDPLRVSLANMLNGPITSYPQIRSIRPTFDSLLIQNGSGTNGECLEIPLADKTPQWKWNYTIIEYDTSINTGHLCIYEAPLDPALYNVDCYCDDDFPIPDTPNADGTYGEFRAIEDEFFFFPHDNPCQGTKITCLSGCQKNDSVRIENVVDATAITLNDEWPYDLDRYGVNTDLNDYENGTRGQWRLQESLTYRTPLSGITSDLPDVLNYESGYYQDFYEYNWKDSKVKEGNDWISASTMTEYSPNGAPVQSLDALDNPSAALYGYAEKLPIMEAINAESNHLLFESFERVYEPTSGNFYFENGLPAAPDGSGSYHTTDQAHAGTYSYYLGKPSIAILPKDVFSLKELTISDLPAEGLVMDFWVKSVRATTTQEYPNPEAIFQVALQGSSGTSTHAVETIAQAGDWWLVRCSLDNFSGIGFTATPVLQMKMSLYLFGFEPEFWLDDLRLKPKDAIATSQVYDELTLLPLAIFDEQHFARFIQYNGAGQAIRTVQETEHGRKTLSEASQHVVKTSR